MTPDRWTQVEPLFEEALDRAAETRESWLAARCPDTALRREVAQLVSASEKAGEFLERSIQVFADDFGNPVVPTEGDLGPYRILREIDRGGMGVVYLAERADGHYEKRVAIKVLRHTLDAADMRRRFLAERQILASLQHPNVARLLDGGITDQERPYIVMDYVEGRPIDAYCRERRATLRDRLALFVTVCDAVQYAHRKLIVHRDLKPSNIFVADDGNVKLLDFGIAKLLDAEESDDAPTTTRTGVQPMTPEYASPEQIRSAPITAASDVYQLGLLLYELLSGHRAHALDRRSISEIARVVCEEEPLPPSRVAANVPEIRPVQLRGDLDAIVLTALRKEPERRYASAALLAADVRSYLDGRPVTAHASSAGYRLRKFARRNPAAVGAGVLFALVLVGYAASVTAQQAQTARERDRTARYAAFLTDLFAGANPIVAEDLGPETTLQAFLQQTTWRIRGELTDDTELQASLLRTIADAHDGLGNDSLARPLFLEVLGHHREAHGERSPQYIETLQRLAWATPDAEAADSLHQMQLRLARSTEGGAGPRTVHGLMIYGNFLFGQGKLEDAARVLDQAAAMSDLGDPEDQVGILYFLAMTQRTIGRLDDADSLLHEAYELESARSGSSHPRTAIIMTELGMIAEARNDFREALRWKQDALAIFEDKLGEEHPYTVSQLNNVGVLNGLMKRFDEEERIYRRVLASREKRLGPTHSETVDILQNLAASLLRQKRLDEAEPMFLEVQRRYAESLQPMHYLHAFPLLSLADLYGQRADFTRAAEAARRAGERLRSALPDEHPLVGVAMSREGDALSGLGRFSEGEGLLLQGHALLRDAEGFDAYRDAAAAALGRLYEAWGRPEEGMRYRELLASQP